MMPVPNSAIQSSKHAIREWVWDLLQARSAVRDPDVHGRIHDFIGSAHAAEQLASMPAWKAAQIVKAVPDKAHLPVRARAVTYVARQLGHDARLTPGTYGHVIGELDDAPRVSGEDAIEAARRGSCVSGVSSPDAADGQ
jgi:hypothetical protein